MTFTQILRQDKKEVASETKLEQLSEKVAEVRKKYGNTDIEIEVPYVPTTDGVVSLKYVDADSKVALAEKAIRTITIQTTEACEANQGVLFDRTVEVLVATNPILCNLSASTGSEYI